ncbi:hypothetical protein [Parvularcula sp. LCG005]|uniref:hypothetical protein n=1 Tax=Parvularcula sp. LCG005 TaxID=3078805 RepID=UPI0029426FCA|nr:hypothetical protein [Parvularcula sp. LCG005]WOI53958.1 hypothetical protein RUI03_02890 [Parvularcula sp. LCG005]
MSRIAGLCALSVLAAAALSGCATEADVEGPYYPSGFSDGCRTAEAQQTSFSQKQYRDEALFDNDSSYRTGWRAGFSQCSGRTQDINARPGDLGEQGSF